MLLGESWFSGHMANHLETFMRSYSCRGKEDKSTLTIVEMNNGSIHCVFGDQLVRVRI
jgi:hypothetical protein